MFFLKKRQKKDLGSTVISFFSVAAGVGQNGDEDDNDDNEDDDPDDDQVRLHILPPEFSLKRICVCFELGGALLKRIGSSVQFVEFCVSLEY